MYPHCGNPKNNSNHDGNPETPMANPEHEERKNTEAEAADFGSHHANHQRQKPRKAEESYMSDRQRRHGSHQHPDHLPCLFAHFTDLSFAPTKVCQPTLYHNFTYRLSLFSIALATSLAIASASGGGTELPICRCRLLFHLCMFTRVAQNRRGDRLACMKKSACPLMHSSEARPKA